MPFFFLNDDYEDMTTGAKLACCLLNQMAMAFGCYTIGLYEGTGKILVNVYRSSS